MKILIENIKQADSSNAFELHDFEEEKNPNKKL